MGRANRTSRLPEALRELGSEGLPSGYGDYWYGEGGDADPLFNLLKKEGYRHQDGRWIRLLDSAERLAAARKNWIEVATADHLYSADTENPPSWSILSRILTSRGLMPGDYEVSLELEGSSWRYRIDGPDGAREGSVADADLESVLEQIDEEVRERAESYRERALQALELQGAVFRHLERHGMEWEPDAPIEDDLWTLGEELFSGGRIINGKIAEGSNPMSNPLLRVFPSLYEKEVDSQTGDLVLRGPGGEEELRGDYTSADSSRAVYAAVNSALENVFERMSRYERNRSLFKGLDPSYADGRLDADLDIRQGRREDLGKYSFVYGSILQGEEEKDLLLLFRDGKFLSDHSIHGQGSGKDLRQEALRLIEEDSP